MPSLTHPSCGGTRMRRLPPSLSPRRPADTAAGTALASPSLGVAVGWLGGLVVPLRRVVDSTRGMQCGQVDRDKPSARLT
jgi:hypothetical protein